MQFNAWLLKLHDVLCWPTDGCHCSAHGSLSKTCLSRQTRRVNWDTSLIIFAEALLKDLIGFHLSTKWLQKSKDFLFMSMLEKILQ